MSDELRKRISSLHKRNCELDEIFAHMGGAVFICASDGSILRMNKAAADLFGLPAGRRKAENRRVDAQHKPHRRRGQDVFRKGARQLRDRARLRKDSGAFELNTPLRLRQAARAIRPARHKPHKGDGDAQARVRGGSFARAQNAAHRPARRRRSPCPRRTRRRRARAFAR